MANSNDSSRIPTTIRLHKQSRMLEIEFSNGSQFELPCEFLRVYSPSAEVRGHGRGQEVLVTGKETVNIAAIEPVGTYAVRLRFDDGHSTGLYSWDYLYRLGKDKEKLWHDYLDRLKEINYQRYSDGDDAESGVPGTRGSAP